MEALVFEAFHGIRWRVALGAAPSKQLFTAHQQNSNIRSPSPQPPLGNSTNNNSSQPSPPATASEWTPSTIAYFQALQTLCQSQRQEYVSLRSQHILSEHRLHSNSTDTQDKVGVNTVDNPLSSDRRSVWFQWFQHSPTLDLIRVDIHRTYQEHDFFTQIHTQKMMERILLIWAIVHPECSYRQGMNELLAIIIMALNKDYTLQLPDDVPSSLASIVNMQFLEHDAFTIFSHLMEIMSIYFSPIASSEGSRLNDRMISIHNVLLREVDPIVYNHLVQHDISPQIFLVKWIRLLFSREFAMHQVIRIWDFLFSNMELIDYVSLAMIQNIRADILKADSNKTISLLIHYPPIEDDIQCLLRMAVYIKRGLEALVQFRSTNNVDVQELTRALQSDVVTVKQFSYNNSSHSNLASLGNGSGGVNIVVSSPTLNSLAPSANGLSHSNSFNNLSHINNNSSSNPVVGGAHSAFTSPNHNNLTINSSQATPSTPNSVSASPAPLTPVGVGSLGKNSGSFSVNSSATGNTALNSALNIPSAMANKRSSLMGFDFSSSATGGSSNEKSSDLTTTFQTALNEEDRALIFPRVSISPASATDADISSFKLAGWLLKRGGGLSALGRKSYKVRWFALHDNVLSYYENPRSNVPLKNSRISLRRAHVHIVDEEKSQFAIFPPANNNFNPNDKNQTNANADDDDDFDDKPTSLGLQPNPLLLNVNNVDGRGSAIIVGSNSNGLLNNNPYAPPSPSHYNNTPASPPGPTGISNGPNTSIVNGGANNGSGSGVVVNGNGSIANQSEQGNGINTNSTNSSQGGKKSKLRTYELYAEDRASLIQWLGALLLATQS